ncbi:hypothetical protein ACKRZS_006971 [Fusarium odoratissimum]
MQEYITEGSIVVINITDLRSDAIIISSNSLRTVALPELSASDARSWVSKDWSTKKKSEQRPKNDEFLDYLSWPWHACVKHIVAEVSASQNNPTEGLPRTLSYAQKQAKRAQEALVAQDANTMLIAAMPTSPKGPGDKKAPKKLPGVEEERREILILTRPHTNALTHPSADQVLEVLKTCRIAHFACHGTSDTFDPYNSGLNLQNEQNLRDLGRRSAHSPTGFGLTA